MFPLKTSCIPIYGFPIKYFINFENGTRSKFQKCLQVEVETIFKIDFYLKTVNRFCEIQLILRIHFPISSKRFFMLQFD